MSNFPYVTNSDIFRSYNDYQGTGNVFTIKESIPKVLKRNSCKEDIYPILWNKFPYNKINYVDALISQIYFGMKLYMFRTDELSETRKSIMPK
jgi:hypothetical protein